MRIVGSVVGGVFKIVGYFVMGFLAVFTAKTLYYKIRDRNSQ